MIENNTFKMIQLYLYLRNICNIKENNIYNIDKKCNILAFISSLKIIIYMKNKYFVCYIITNCELV